ncbi:hypothetical protein [Streptosporangium sp. NPDC051022]|uniref:hypothetical protein n=1 Tax=Streptosporangium sp. NPDC051022 TaxID=3155752 RepID=UPI00343424EF
MRRTITLLAPVALAATLLGSAATAPAIADTASSSAPVTLDLYAEHNQTGDVEHVQVPSGENCVTLDSAFKTYSAHNHSGRFIAALYSNGDCSGEPVEVVGKFKKANFSKRHEVESINFVE